MTDSIRNRNQRYILSSFIPLLFLCALYQMYRGDGRPLVFMEFALTLLVIWVYTGNKGWLSHLSIHNLFLWAAIVAVITTVYAYFFNSYTGVVTRLLGAMSTTVTTQVDLIALWRCLLSVFVIYSVFVMDRKAYDLGVRAIAWIVWFLTLYSIGVYVKHILVNHVVFYDRSSFNVWAGNPIPAGTIIIAALFIPMFRDIKKELAFKAVLIVGVVITFSRSAWIGAALGVFVMLIPYWKGLGKYIKVAVVATLAVLIFWGVWWTIAARSDSDGTRILQLVYSLRLIKNSSGLALLFGHGMGTSGMALAQYFGETFYTVCDDMYLTVIYEHGVFVFLAVVLVPVRAFVFYVRDRSEDILLKRYALACVGVMTSLLFYDGHKWPEIAVMIAVCGVAFMSEERRILSNNTNIK